jgi:hypothetical protein
MSRSGDAFETMLLEPVIVRGQTVAPRGTPLAGKVLEARAAGPLQDSGYMRLALTAISVNGKPLPIQTSNLFVKGGPRQKRGLAMTNLASQRQDALQGASVTNPTTTPMPYETWSQDVTIVPERHLTFHLAQPLPLEF